MKKILLLLALLPCISYGNGIDAVLLYGNPLIHIANTDNTLQNKRDLYLIGKGFYTVNETFQLGIGVELLYSKYQTQTVSSSTTTMPIYAEANRVFDLGDLYITGGIYLGLLYNTDRDTYNNSTTVKHANGYVSGFDMGLTYDIVKWLGIRAETGVRLYTTNFSDGSLLMPFAVGIVAHI